MPGNSARRGAVRRSGKNTAGSGGRGRARLQGKGPTPKAEDRTYHPAYRRKKAADQARRRPQRRTGAAEEMVAGRNSVLEALQAGVPATTLYVVPGGAADQRVKKAIRVAGDQGISLTEASRADLDRLSDGAVHQGIALRISPYQYAQVPDLLARAQRNAPLLVALDSVTDPRNLGAVIRSAAAFGAHGVIIPNRRAAAMTAAAWKVSAGAAARVPVAQVTNLVRTLTELKRQGCFCYGLDAGGDVALPDLSVRSGTDPTVLVVGSEGAGLSRLVRQTCDQVVSIPIDWATESLNAGVAAGIALYALAQARAAEEPR
ncbi:MAG: 23S rRNA (guanosine(2251)-2'-O)-methyltransferase RlmB [Micrococcales bacterium]|nr:MAG: 23S rRNA (guanosine(2251)-2'-O)-methyltransferase RlmB [Micrococcales bacterium]PIE27138.1 MAG: 23S rRNA (guanosine(2251)-2'-O)-methyltransferase RlmB [Micrococcales bacterium]